MTSKLQQQYLDNIQNQKKKKLTKSATRLAKDEEFKSEDDSSLSLNSQNS
jgi:hypothetical protein